MPVILVAPLSHEASDGRVELVASAGTDRLVVSVGGRAGSDVAILQASGTGAMRRITAQLDVVDAAGTSLEVRAFRGEVAAGRAAVEDIHLLGAEAFRQPAARRLNAKANAAAQAIVTSLRAPIGISLECLGTGWRAGANANHRAIAGSTLKAAIVARALALDAGDPTRPEVFPTYEAAIVNSSNDAANVLLTKMGDGSPRTGAVRMNEFFGALDMTSSYLDGPYAVGTPGPSLKRTSANDLTQLMRAIGTTAATGGGQLASAGVTQHEARVLLGLLAGTEYPGLVRPNLAGPVAHKAGWLDSVQNDAAIAFDISGGPCIVSLTTEGLGLGEATAIGHRVVTEVLPLLTTPAPTVRATRPAAETRTVVVTPARKAEPPAQVATRPRHAGRSWTMIGSSLALVLSVGLATLAIFARRRAVARQRRHHRRR